MDLKGKCVLLGVSGGIAAYKMANVASALRKLGADVEVIMTKNATQFITPVTFETLTGHKCMVDTFDRDFKFEVTHISLAKKADVILVAPATANVIAKMAHGIADDMLTTTVLAAKCPKLVSPAMNTGMLENPITQDNIATLERYGFTVIPSESGVLACKDVGSGRLPKEDVLIEYILHAIARPKDLAGLRIAVTAGPTQEPLDPVRYLTNHSTGKMGYALARAAAMRGADVTLIHFPRFGLGSIFFYAENSAARITPDGEIIPLEQGTAHIYAVATGNTSVYKSISIEVVPPRLRIAGDALRLDAEGNLRLT